MSLTDSRAKPKGRLDGQVGLSREVQIKRARGVADKMCWRNGIYILWLTSSPCKKNSGELSSAHGQVIMQVFRFDWDTCMWVVF